jgi:uncharacterized repeat protein (TIGR03803 family)
MKHTTSSRRLIRLAVAMPLSLTAAFARTARCMLRSMSLLAMLIIAVLITAPNARAQTYTVVHSFCSQPSCADGYGPDTPLVQATDGNLYGTTAGILKPVEGAGSVFKLTLGGTLTTVYKFCSGGDSPKCSDGSRPSGALIQATNGNLYGTTGTGGLKGAGTGAGIIFSLTTAGDLTVLYNFCSQPGCIDGEGPMGLVQAANGDFYGAAGDGGYNHYGTLFSITPNGTQTTLHVFQRKCCGDGAYPVGTPIQATNGTLYGTTQYGGPDDGGSIYQISGGKVSTFYSFEQTVSGGPSGGLVQASDGNFYGTTGGAIFKLTGSGTQTTLFTFCPEGQTCYTTYGQYPNGPLIQATDGNFYGTTSQGGANNFGTIFRMTPSGVITTLYSFCSTSVPTHCADGYNSQTGLIQATDGNLYGITSNGGDCGSVFPSQNGCGVLYKLDIGLGPFIAPQTKFGAVGSSVTILGTDLAGVSKVTFNGTPATFTVNSTASAITATVPVGATTGTIQVALPNVTLLSNVAFQVTQ